jgi:hypothetical protein
VRELQTCDVVHGQPPDVVMLVRGDVRGRTTPLTHDPQIEYEAIRTRGRLRDAQPRLALDGRQNPEFLVQLSLKRNTPALSKLDVAAGKVPTIRVERQIRAAMDKQDPFGPDKRSAHHTMSHACIPAHGKR